MKRTIFVMLIALATTAAQDTEKKKEDPRFAFLKKLKGTWVAKQGEKEMTFKYSITAGGSVVEERIFVGTPHEMVTMYHMNGKKLVATHYCMMRNQPRFEAAKEIKDDTLVLTCDGKVSGTTSHDDAHMHRLSLKRGKDDVLHLSSDLYKDGKKAGTNAFKLKRKKK